ncbi:AEC family transporter [Flavobacterium selenitireducens]|uniref:AEC family transporter n=1 Tax=Flavobacterium selenitireducens TaxID=2722704 RepID=UPI00168B92DE|nr:AEC family transporter [Flavobacterium selenitireducens]MBD3582536.1 AEC family transporter [Flavobacterium selenitireducens]
MESILLLLVCLAVGVGLQYVKSFPPNAHQVLNQFVIHISLPALALFYIPKIVISTRLLFPLGVAWIGFVLMWISFAFMGRLFGWSRKLTGCMILLTGLGNTSFVGFPIIEALYGKEGLKTAIIVDQPGSFMVMATLGITVAALYSRGVPDAKAIAKRIAFFPPFLAFAIAIILNLSHADFPEMLQIVFQKLGTTVTPIALVAVGMQLRFGQKSRHWPFLALGLFFKLFVTPAFFLLAYKFAFDENGLAIDVSIMEAAMAPMITASVLASSHGLKPKLSNMMIGIGIPLSFLTLAFWYWILGRI